MKMLQRLSFSSVLFCPLAPHILPLRQLRRSGQASQNTLLCLLIGLHDLIQAAELNLNTRLSAKPCQQDFHYVSCVYRGKQKEEFRQLSVLSDTLQYEMDS